MIPLIGLSLLHLSACRSKVGPMSSFVVISVFKHLWIEGWFTVHYTVYHYCIAFFFIFRNVSVSAIIHIQYIYIVVIYNIYLCDLMKQIEGQSFGSEYE